MEIVNIDAQTFEKMLSKFERFAGRMEQLHRQHGTRDVGEWLDNQDVCLLLKISPVTLQTLRDNGTLAISRINHKIYYKSEDVEKIVPLVEGKCKQAVYKRKRA